MTEEAGWGREEGSGKLTALGKLHLGGLPCIPPVRCQRCLLMAWALLRQAA
jgi:hypothetical protein